ncbi:unnamed protein product [Lathyrus sativus]|nr:unnamed protein product [Lathyrus sativus]
MSRFNYFLISEGLVDLWRMKGKSIGNQEVSDNVPIWLKVNLLNWGKNLFIFKDKLKQLKASLKAWNLEVLGRQEMGFEEAILYLISLDDLVGNYVEPLSSILFRWISLTQSLVWEQLHRRKSMLRKKSRCKWLKAED